MDNIPQVKLNSGHSIPAVGYGTSRIRQSMDIIDGVSSALDCGYRHIDSASAYRNEKEIGNILQEYISQGKLRREDVFITTKLPASANRPEDVRRVADLSLKSLKTDYIDLYLIHGPFAFIKGKSDEDMFPIDANGMILFEPKFDLEGVWKEMEKLADSGLAKSIGVSNFNSEQMHSLAKSARILPAVNQVEAHVYLQQRNLNEVCQQYGTRITAYAPLGAPDKKRGSLDVPNVLEDSEVIAIATKRKKTPAQIALRFLTQLGYVVIPKSAKIIRMKENIELFDFELTDDEMSQLKKLDLGPNGRVFVLTDICKGIENCVDYPFHIPF